LQPGDKPSIAGERRLYEQHMQTTGSQPMSSYPFSVIAREVLNQPQHQKLASASHFPSTLQKQHNSKSTGVTPD
jgi:hypothetical protein